jgi:hypothetical protein
MHEVYLSSSFTRKTDMVVVDIHLFLKGRTTLYVYIYLSLLPSVLLSQPYEIRKRRHVFAFGDFDFDLMTSVHVLDTHMCTYEKENVEDQLRFFASFDREGSWV